MISYRPRRPRRGTHPTATRDTRRGHLYEGIDSAGANPAHVSARRGLFLIGNGDPITGRLVVARSPTRQTVHIQQPDL